MATVEQIRKYDKGIERLKDAFQYNEGVREAWTPIWCRNAGRSYAIVERIFSKRNADMAYLREHYKPAPTIILGSGPSQHDIRPYLKDWKGNLFISTSQLPLCAYLGVEPTAVVLIDSDPRMIYLMKDHLDYYKDKKTLLIVHPQVPREYLELWPEDKIWLFRMLDPGDEFSNRYLPLIYGLMNEKTGWALRSTILNGGNIVNTMIPFVNAFNQLDTTKKHPIFLAGYDLGYPDGLLRCSEVKKDANGNWEEIPAPPLTEKRWKQATKQESNNGIPTDDLGVFYKTSSMILLGMSNPPIISCSRGIMTEWPRVDPKEVIERQGQGYEHLFYSDADAYRLAQAYLIPRGFLILKTDFWVSVTNLGSEKGLLRRCRKMIEFRWFNNKPWKWLGGKGYTPRRVKKARKAQLKKAKESKNVQGEKHTDNGRDGDPGAESGTASAFGGFASQSGNLFEKRSTSGGNEG